MNPFQEIIGDLEHRQQWQLRPSSASTRRIVIPGDQLRGAREDDKVVVRVHADCLSECSVVGEVIEILGASGRLDVERQAVLRAFDLEHSFSASALNQAAEVEKQFSGKLQLEQVRRRDCTALLAVAIDPACANDIDDALSLDERSGAEEVVVHIADAANLIPADSPLDCEARQRGASLYGLGLSQPMLPPSVARLCSLVPGKRRLALSVFLQIGTDGEVIRRRVARTIIRPTHRLTYGEAQVWYSSRAATPNNDAASRHPHNSQLSKMLKRLVELAARVTARHWRNGRLELGFDQADRPGASHQDQAIHSMVETFMVEANCTIAELLNAFQLPFLRRVLPDPAQKRWDDLRAFLTPLGIRLGTTASREELQRAYLQSRRTNYSSSAQREIVRMLGRAEYAVGQTGHYALAVPHYCHFTSPIRRYADMSIQRAVHSLLDHAGRCELEFVAGQPNPLAPDLPEKDVAAIRELSEHCNRREEEKILAQRRLERLTALDSLQKLQGVVVPGIVRSVESYGVFVEFGMGQSRGRFAPYQLAVSDRRIWHIDADARQIVNDRTGEHFKPNDRVWTRVKKVNLSRQQVDLDLLEPRGDRDTPSRPPALPKGDRRQATACVR